MNNFKATIDNMNKNPFLHNIPEEEGSPAERMEVRHSLGHDRYSDELSDTDITEEWERLCDRLGFEEPVVAPTDSPAYADEKPERRRRFPKGIFAWGSVAAAAVILIGICMWLLPQPVTPDSHKVYIASRPLADNVTLSLPGGEKKVVKATKVSVESLVKERRSKTGMLSIVTPPGEELLITLPDSSSVWLWANSKLEFPSAFTGQERKVFLEGDAYFDVRTDSMRPFIVHTPYFETRVFGTEFVIDATTRKDASVTLVEGRVGVSTNGNSDKSAMQMLSPGEEAVCEPAGGFSVKEVDIYPLKQWRDGLFYYDNAPFMDILISLGRWYNASVIVENDSLLTQRLHFVADRKADTKETFTELGELASCSVSYNGLEIRVK